MIEIKPTPELDRAIAKAIDLRWLVIEGPPRYVLGLYNPISEDSTEVSVSADDDLVTDAMISFYSTDLNAAFVAAEKVSLFYPPENTHGQGPWVSLARGPWGWQVMKDEMCLGRGDTPALAICAGILKLAEEEES